MPHANASDPTSKAENKDFRISAVHQRLSLALESSGQVAFDWHIPDDRLYFSGALAGDLSNVLLDTSKTWRSVDLPAIMHDDDQENFRKRLHETLKGKFRDNAFYRAELRLKDAGCSWRWVEISGKIVERDSAQRALRMAGTFSDIHDRKQAERKAARQRSLYAALSQAAQAIVRAGDHDTLFHALCRIAVDHGGFHIAWIGVRHDEHLVPAASYRGGRDASGDIPASCGRLRLDYDSAIARALRERRPAVCTARAGAPAAHGAMPLMHGHLRSAACIPFDLPGNGAGAFNLYSTEADFFDAATIGVLEKMAQDLSFALDKNARGVPRESPVEEAASREKLDSAILSAAPDCIVSIDRDGIIIGYNQAAELAFGYRSGDVLGRKLTDALIAPEWRHELQREIERLLACGESRMLNRRIELTALRSNGSTFAAELAVVPLSLHGGPSFTAFIRDISEQKRAEALQLGQNRILNLIAADATLHDILSGIARFAETQSGRAMCSIIPLDDEAGGGLSGPVAPGLPPSVVARCAAADLACGGDRTGRIAPLPPDDTGHDGTESAWRDTRSAHGLKTYASWPIIGKNRMRLGSFVLYFRDSAAPTAHERQVAGICIRLAGIAIERRSSDARIRYLAHYDGLTALPNRFLFRERLDIVLRTARRSGRRLALLFVDLDRFKEINDTLGHDAGDLVLREIANRMRHSLRDTDMIARMGGDEFYVLIEELSDGRHAGDIAKKLLAEASRPVAVCGEECRLSASIGISIYPDDGTDGASLLRHADCAMYRAKRLGKDGYQFFSAGHETCDALPPPPLPGGGVESTGMS